VPLSVTLGKRAASGLPDFLSLADPGKYACL